MTGFQGMRNDNINISETRFQTFNTFFLVISQESWELGIELVVPGYRDFVKSQEEQGLKRGGRVNKEAGGGVYLQMFD